MKIPTRSRQYGIRFDITPLNDIVFLLIIFLIAAPHFTGKSHAEQIDLPTMNLSKTDASTKPLSPDEWQLEITIHHNGKLQIENREVTPLELQKRLQLIGQQLQQQQNRPFEVRLRVDQKTPFKVVEPLLIECALAKITDVKFAILPMKSKKIFYHQDTKDTK